jgi:membrane-associated phospholipid phosphatase
MSGGINMEKLVINENMNIKKVRNFVMSLCVMLVIAPLNLGYIFLNTSKRGFHSLVTSADNSIPFIKVFILPYVGWYAFIFIMMVYLCYKDRETYFITLIAYMLGLVASFITFYLFQTTVPRPEIIGSDYLSRMVLSIYRADKPYNCFPSIHVLTSFLMIKAIMISSIRTKTNTFIVWASAILIIVSTLFIKQHVILDVVSGIVYADILFRLVQVYGVLLWGIVKKQYSSIGVKKKLEIE